MRRLTVIKREWHVVSLAFWLGSDARFCETSAQIWTQEKDTVILCPQINDGFHTQFLLNKLSIAHCSIVLKIVCKLDAR